MPPDSPAGTLLFFTVDGQPTPDNTITIGDRDTMEQTRHKIADLGDILAKKPD